ncbi:MAG: AfsR/SARP family transcriptional regulator [Gaiella sp.]|nr:AfsR/SARP family transcriptional regulator [Gaiella sp.]
MEILVLGPLEARSARARLSLGGPRQRALLAELVLHVGTVVSMDAIVDDLWGGTPPATAEAVVQNAVARLRRVLGREAIETRPPGYVLRLDPGAIDAHRFERLVHDAQPLPATERLGILGDALALWRGPAFADLAYESFLQDEIARLDELRLTALEDRIEAEVELGQHHDAVPAAATLATQHRERERLCRLLMLALHRAGRQQEALDAYEATRRALDELWGLEPAEATRALQRMILTHDPAISGTKPVAEVAGLVRRPGSLLLVEPLLDDELELEAAGAALDACGMPSPRSPRATAACCRRGRARSSSRRSGSTGPTRTTPSAPLAPRSSCARSCATAASTPGRRWVREGSSSRERSRFSSARS